MKIIFHFSLNLFPDDKPADIALVMATHSYMAYANDNLSVNSVIAELLTGQIPLLQPEDLLLNKERGYGLGTYTSYRDGWGVNVSSRLRPILNMRPKYLHVLSPLFGSSMPTFIW